MSNNHSFEEQPTKIKQPRNGAIVISEEPPVTPEGSTRARCLPFLERTWENYGNNTTRMRFYKANADIERKHTIFSLSLSLYSSL